MPLSSPMQQRRQQRKACSWRLIWYVVSKEATDIHSERSQSPIRISKITSGRNKCCQSDQCAIGTAACQGIPEQEPFHHVLVCGNTAATLKPVVNKLSDVPFPYYKAVNN